MKRIFYSLTSIVAFLFFTLNTHAQATYTMMTPVDAPPGGSGGAQANVNNGAALETGIRFKVTQGGYVNAIRFYKGVSNTGTHIGNLWQPTVATGATTGSLLTTVTFTGETASGWQEMAFPAPVLLLPGVEYVASVFNASGFYAFDEAPGGGGFIEPNFDRVSAPFIILAGDGTTQASADPLDPVTTPGLPNGAYIINATSAYPELGSATTQYFIDIVFEPLYALPVELTYIKATAISKDIELNWKTASENNNKGFEIQRSNNGRDWYTIGFMNGAGTSSAPLNYTYIDKELASGRYYYRLNQQDFDGKTTSISSVVNATIGGKGNTILFPVSPNPLKGQASIRFNLPETQKIRLSLFDITGREVKVLLDNTAAKGSNVVPMNTNGLGRQLYILRLQTGDETKTQKIIIE